MSTRKWKEVWERLPVERRDETLATISGFDRFCTDQTAFRRKTFRYLSREFGPLAGRNLCEIGCGCGDKLKPFHERGVRCHGADYSAPMIERARREMPGASLFVAEAERLPFADNSMDVVFSYGVFLYFETLAYARRSLAEIWRIARPGARVVLLDVPDAANAAEIFRFRGKPRKHYEHTLYPADFFLQWFRRRDCPKVKVEYVVLPEYAHSRHRFHVAATLPAK